MSITSERKWREAYAKERAAKLPSGDYYASGSQVWCHQRKQAVLDCDSHWDACLVMMAANGGKHASE